jgi:elongation factor 1 alpha-like protein
LTKGQSAVVEIQLQKPICLELYQNFKELGKFMLRAGGATIAAGLITEVHTFLFYIFEKIIK